MSDTQGQTPQFGDREASSKAASRAMQGNTKRDTKPEIQLRKALWARGARYRLHAPDLPGKPDLVFPGKKVAIFCDGDFWHGRHWEDRKERLSKGSNADYWVPKIRANMLRDRRNTDSLEDAGWTVLRFWEGEINKDCEGIVDEIISVLQGLRI